MWEAGLHHRKSTQNVNDRLLALQGTLKDREAKITLVDFLRNNPTFAVRLLVGVKLFPFQQMMIKAMFQRNNFLAVCSRGLGKSYIGSLFCMLYAIFNQGVKIAIVSKTFRQARMMFKKIEDFANSKEGEFLRQCIGDTRKNIKHNADAWEMNIGASVIMALPLGAGDKIRGYRFNVMVIDELLLLDDKVINEVLKPFLIVSIDPHATGRAMKLLREGLVTDDEYRLLLPDPPKIIGLTSASYTFDYLYEMYSEFIYKITNTHDKKGQKLTGISHCVMQLAYQVAPEGLYDPQLVKELESSMSEQQLQRELGAQFTDDSGGFYSSRKMQEATVPLGMRPTTKIVGDQDKKYILAIDPNYSDSESSDHFAMSVVEIYEETRKGVLVHGYAVAKSNLGARTRYLKYLFDNFNIVYVIVDNAGGPKFLQDAQEFPEFKGFKLEFFEQDFENEDYQEGVRNSKADYNLSEGKICHAQKFATKWIRSANESLQNCIEKKRIMFASSIHAIEEEHSKQLKQRVGIENIDYELEGNMPQDLAQKQAELIDNQEYIIDLTKTQCSMIVVSTNPTGGQTFDLPSNLRKSTSPDKARRDSYSTLLLANWALKCYFDMIDAPEEENNTFFIPTSYR
jgi:hypothetical protein